MKHHFWYEAWDQRCISFASSSFSFSPNKIIIPLLVQEVSNIDGRWCIKSGADQLKGVKGLLLSRSSKLYCVTSKIITHANTF